MKYILYPGAIMVAILITVRIIMERGVTAFLIENTDEQINEVFSHDYQAGAALVALSAAFYITLFLIIT